ncbi:MAG TPA: hypothetical protein ENF97_00175 [Candidatus Omnitrophica bacterium]|nr:hypothetical protein [Candidatus Omnitrophota bacterium]
MGKIKPTTQEERILGGVVYLILFLGVLGWIIDGFIYWKARKRYTRLHAGQACFIELIVVIVSILTIITTIFTPYNEIIAAALGMVFVLVYLVFAIATLTGNEIEIPYIVRMVRR